MPPVSRTGLSTPAMSRRVTPDERPARFEFTATLKTGIKEASDVTALPNGRFLVVGDRGDQAHVVDRDGRRLDVELPGVKNGKSQFEGVAFDPHRNHLFVAREEAGELLRFEWNPDAGNAAIKERRFDLPAGSSRNKGVEGLAYLDGAVSPTGKPQLLIANEGKPRRISMLPDDGKGKPLPVSLEREVYAACRDFSALAVDPRSGHLFISSDESATAVQVKLVRDGDAIRGQLVQAFPLRDGKGKALDRVEGLSFNERGDLFVLTENDGKLHQLSRQ